MSTSELADAGAPPQPQTLEDAASAPLDEPPPPTPGDASAALTTLFSSTQGLLDLPIDPALEGEGVRDTGSGAADDAAVGGEAEGNSAQGAVGEQGDAGEEGANPTDASGTTAAPVKRKATSRANMLARGGACEFCKRRKLKCTAELPRCAACARSGKECVYSQKKQRSRVRVLEDRLQELERRLDVERSRGEGTGATGSTGVGASGAPLSSSSGTNAATFISPESNPTPSSGVELFNLGLDEGLTLAEFVKPPREPDLMTLADAAAADGEQAQPWDGLEPQAVADELVKALVENQRGGVGEKIVQHLFQQFVDTKKAVRLVHCLVDPGFLMRRLSGHGLAPHPALLTALMPMLLVGSPSDNLSDTATASAATDALMAPSRMFAQHALTTLDTRCLDLVAASTLRCLALATQGRFVDAWNENSGSAALVWATGLGKLGGVGERFAPPEAHSPERAQRMEREARIRMVRGKGQIVPPPRNAQDVGDRIRLFWSVFICDRSNAIGWNWPAAIDQEEITTPLPRESYDTPEALCDNTTLDDFLSGRVIGHRDEYIMTAIVKSVTLACEASRQLDRLPSVATPERTSHLLRITKRYMAVIRPFAPTTPKEARQGASINSVWMALHIAMLLLYSKEEIDAPDEREAHEALEKTIAAGMKMCDCIEAAYAAGDTNLSHYDILAPTLWFVTGRAFHHIARRLEPTDPARAAVLRERLQFVVDATRKLSRELRLAEVHAQLLYNVSLDAEVMLGEYIRPDNVEFMV